MTNEPLLLRLKNVTIGDTTTGQFWAGDRRMADILYASPDDAEAVFLLLQPYPAPSPDDERALRIGRAVMASHPRRAGSTGDIPYAWGYNSARVEFLAAGEVEG